MLASSCSFLRVSPPCFGQQIQTVQSTLLSQNGLLLCRQTYKEQMECQMRRQNQPFQSQPSRNHVLQATHNRLHEQAPKIFQNKAQGRLYGDSSAPGGRMHNLLYERARKILQKKNSKLDCNDGRLNGSWDGSTYWNQKAPEIPLSSWSCVAFCWPVPSEFLQVKSTCSCVEETTAVGRC
jgi:hypothetical protein